MNVKKIEVGILQTNCYILNKNNKCLIIDPGDEIDKIINNIEGEVIGIIVTHYHFDHIGALEQLKNKYNVNVYDISNLQEKEYNISDFKFEVIHTKGHHFTCITIYFKEDNIMFTGDFLFKQSIGRTDLEGSNELEMYESLEKIKKYSDDIKLYPGHGESTNLGYEKKYNIFF